MEVNPDEGPRVAPGGKPPERIADERDNPLLQPLNNLLDDAVDAINRDRQEVEEVLPERDYERLVEGDIDARVGPAGAEVRRTRPSNRETMRQVKQIRKAIRKGDVQKLNTLLTKYPNAVNGSSRVVLSPLEMANCHPNDSVRQALIQTILQHSPDLTVRDRVGCTVLHRLTYGGHQNLIEEVRRHAGPDWANLLQQANDYGRTPQDYAQILGAPGLVNLLDPEGRAAPPPPDEAPPADRVGGPRPGDLYPAAPLPPVPERMRPGELREGGLLHGVRGLNLGVEHDRYAKRPPTVGVQQVVDAFDYLLTGREVSAGRLTFDSGRGHIDVTDVDALPKDIRAIRNCFQYRPSQRHLFVPIALSDGRAASMVCDIRDRTIEIFDPNGKGDDEELNGFLQTLEGAFSRLNVNILATKTHQLTSNIEDSGPYALLFAQSRIEHPEVAPQEFQTHIEQLAAEGAMGRKRGIEGYRKDVIGAALRLHTIEASKAVTSQNRLRISDDDRAKAEKNFRQRFPYTYESERLRLAHYNLTPYDLINETDAYQNVVAPKPLDEEEDVELDRGPAVE